MFKNTLGIYINVPFCKSKCPYCDFYSLTNYQNISGYVNSVCSQIEKWGKELNKYVDTIYFGGGTPSLLQTDEILKILSAIRNNFKVMHPEVTLEVNPADCANMDFKKLAFYGVNRISLGAQSLNDFQLKILGRRHNFKDIDIAVSLIKKAGINNISCDIILGTPGQTVIDIKDFSYFCRQNNIPHISAYILKIEKNTPYYFNKNHLRFFDDDKLADFYFYTCNLMNKLGYNHYEISNFSKKGFESKHNLKYWSLKDYLGVGPSAHSLVNGKRFYYPKSVDEFINCPKIISEGNFEPEKEFIMLSLRTSIGLTNENFKNMLGYDIPKIYFEKAVKFEKYGLVSLKSSSINLTERGFLLSNYIISEIL